MSSPPPAPEKVYVEIPKAKPGQEYRAPKNYDQPLLQTLSRIVVALICLSLVAVPAGILGAIMLRPSGQSLLWLFIPLAVLVEAFAIFVAIGTYREAVGSAGDDWRAR
jgi:hypothetical protein